MQLGATAVLKCTTHRGTDQVANGTTNLPNSNWLPANSIWIRANSVYFQVMILSLTDLSKTIRKSEIFPVSGYETYLCMQKKLSVNRYDQLSVHNHRKMPERW